MPEVVDSLGWLAGFVLYVWWQVMSWDRASIHWLVCHDLQAQRGNPSGSGGWWLMTRRALQVKPWNCSCRTPQTSPPHWTWPHPLKSWCTGKRLGEWRSCLPCLATPCALNIYVRWVVFFLSSKPLLCIPVLISPFTCLFQRFSQNLVTKPVKDEDAEGQLELDQQQDQQQPQQQQQQAASASTAADESLGMPELARDQSTAFEDTLEAPVLEAPSLADEPSERPSLADASASFARLMPEDSIAPTPGGLAVDSLTALPPAEESLSPPELQETLRADSGDEDVDDIFNNLPSDREDSNDGVVSWVYHISFDLCMLSVLWHGLQLLLSCSRLTVMRSRSRSAGANVRSTCSTFCPSTCLSPMTPPPSKPWSPATTVSRWHPSSTPSLYSKRCRPLRSSRVSRMVTSSSQEGHDLRWSSKVVILHCAVYCWCVVVKAMLACVVSFEWLILILVYCGLKPMHLIYHARMELFHLPWQHWTDLCEYLSKI